jgi:hypothetical protein
MLHSCDDDDRALRGTIPERSASASTTAKIVRGMKARAELQWREAKDKGEAPFKIYEDAVLDSREFWHMKKMERKRATNHPLG